MRSISFVLIVAFLLTSCHKSNSIVGEWELIGNALINGVDYNGKPYGTILSEGCTYIFLNDDKCKLVIHKSSPSESIVLEGVWSLNKMEDTLIVVGNAALNREERHRFEIVGDTLRIYTSTENRDLLVSRNDFLRK